jgi:hypothetical protein
MTNILQQIKALETPKVEPPVIEPKRKYDNQNKIILDPKQDPDPFGLHGMSLAYRLQCMGWRE